MCPFSVENCLGKGNRQSANGKKMRGGNSAGRKTDQSAFSIGQREESRMMEGGRGNSCAFSQNLTSCKVDVRYQFLVSFDGF